MYLPNTYHPIFRVCSLLNFLLFSEYEFTVSEIQFKIIDVGGDKDERRRWIDFLQVLHFYIILSSGPSLLH